MNRMRNHFWGIVLVALFAIVAQASMAAGNQISFHRDASGEWSLREDRLVFEKADSGNVRVNAWVVRKQGGLETVEHWQFSFRLPVLGKILSGEAQFEQSFFPYAASHGNRYQNLLQTCAEQGLFPRTLVNPCAVSRE